MTMISGKYDEDNLSGHMQHSASIGEVSSFNETQSDEYIFLL